MRKRLVVLTALTLWGILPLYAQNDSLLRIVKQTKNDSIRFETYGQLFQKTIFQDIDSAHYFIQAQKKMIAKASFNQKEKEKFSMDYHVNAGVYFNKKGQPELALNHYEKAENIAKNASLTKERATILNNIANLFYQKGNYPVSLDYHLKGLKLRKDIQDTIGIGMSLGNIGLIHEVMGDYDKAIANYSQAQTYFKKAHNDRYEAWVLRSLGTAYMELKNFQKSIENLNASKAICIKSGDKSGMNYCLLNLAAVFLEQHVENQRAYYLDSADHFLLSIQNVHQDVRVEINQLIYSAKVDNFRANFSDAKSSLEKAKELISGDNFRNELKDLHEALSESYAGLGDYRSALQEHRAFKSLSDDIFSVEKDAEMGRKQAVFEYEEKLRIEQIEKENLANVHDLEQRKQLFVFLFIGSLSLLVITLLILLYRRKVRLSEQLKLERDSILRKFESLEKAYTTVLSNLSQVHENKLKQADSPQELPDWIGALSKRELEVLSCLAVGMGDKEIEQKLFISVSTVRTHCQRIYGKLLVKNRSEAAHLAREYGLL